MKAILIILSLWTSQLTASASSTPTMDPKFATSFTQTFAGASDIRWEEMGELYKVSFFQEGKPVTAFYDANGKLVATTRNISSSELPAALRQSLQKEMGNRWITQLFEMTNSEGSAYYVALQGSDDTLVMQSAGARKWFRF